MLGAVASGLGGATPFGAAAGAISAVAATPVSSSATLGPVNIGGLDFGASSSSSWAQAAAALGVALFALAIVATRRSR